MDTETDKRSGLRLIQGGRHCSMLFNGVRIVAAPEYLPPFDVDAIAFEEDTWLVLSADPKVCEPDEHPIRLMTELMGAKPEPVGGVLVKGHNPIRFLAIVHDVDQEPTWKEEWVQSALREIFRTAEQRRLRSVGLPLLGTLHGRLEKKRFVELLGRLLGQRSFNHLRSLWLITPAGSCHDIIESLESMAGKNERY